MEGDGMIGKSANVGSDRIGEVVEADTLGFTGQCYNLHRAPPLGSIVQTTNPSIYSVVSEIRTEALDPGRPIVARGQEEATEEDLYRNNPQLDRLLCTKFKTLTIAYAEGDTILQGLPPLPCKIHAFIYLPLKEDLEIVLSSLHFLHMLANDRSPATDEVIAACLRLASRQMTNGPGFLLQAGKTLAVELSGQLLRLNAILRRLT